MAVIKANAYGHGMLPVARALADDVDAFAVARLAEARTLRAAGIDTPIVVLGGALGPDDIADGISLDVQLGIHDQQQIHWIVGGKKPLATAWLKIDTGMHRLGLEPDEAPAAIETLRPYVRDLRLMTHFSNADDPDDPTTRDQLARFLPVIEDFEGDVSVANSPGILGWTDEIDRLRSSRHKGRLWVRPGLALYGISPFSGQTGAGLGLEPAMVFESTLISVKPLLAGEPVGYGGTWSAERDTLLGVIAVGYGDGYTRYIPAGTPVLVNGRLVAVAGRVSMDLTAVDLGPDAADRVGDRAILWGEDLPVEEVARHAGTIPYQLVTGVTHREACVLEES
jgi:alanine racemase